MLHVIGDCARNRDAAGFGQLLQPGRDDHAFAVAVLVLDDHVAEIDAHAHVDALPVGEAIVPLGHLPLEQHRAFDGIHDAAEFGQQAVARQLEDAAVMPGDFGFEEVFPVRAQAFERIRLIILHEAAVADDVDREDRG